MRPRIGIWTVWSLVLIKHTGLKVHLRQGFMRYVIAALLMISGLNANAADPFTGTWEHKDEKMVETVIIKASGDEYRAVSSLQPKEMDIFGPVNMTFVKESDHLLIDKKTHADRWELLPGGQAKSSMRHRAEVFERVE